MMLVQKYQILVLNIKLGFKGLIVILDLLNAHS